MLVHLKIFVFPVGIFPDINHRNNLWIYFTYPVKRQRDRR